MRRSILQKKAIRKGQPFLYHKRIPSYKFKRTS